MVVAAHNITSSVFSKGAIITLAISGLINNTAINYIFSPDALNFLTLNTIYCQQ